MQSPKFITLEGIEGVGKSVNIEYVCKLLEQRNIEYITTREPGGTKVAEAIRSILLSHGDERLTPETETLLIFAARKQHLTHVIEPALAKGQWVVCDRFTDATFAYQGGGRHQDVQHIAYLETWLQGKLRPDLTLILDAPPEVGLARAKARNMLDRFESESVQFFDDVRKMYLTRAKQFPHSHKIIDANRSLDLVQRSILDIVKTNFKAVF